MAPSATSSAISSRRGAGDGAAGNCLDEVMSHKPDGFFLSNGPGDPAATGEYAVPVIKQMLETVASRCSASVRPPDAGAGGRRQDGQDVPGPPRRQSPVKRLADGRVEITSMNHGFAVERQACRTTSAKPTSACSTTAIAG